MYKNSTPRGKQLVLATLLVSFLAFNEIHFRDQLYNFSLNFIQKSQADLSPDVFKYPLQLVSSVSNPVAVTIGVIGLFILPTNKIFMTKIVIYIVAMAYTLSILKSIYGNPRPYWVRPYVPGLPNSSESGIIPLETYAEFGNPSGHMFFAVGLYGYLYNLYLRRKRDEEIASDPSIVVKPKKSAPSSIKETINGTTSQSEAESDTSQLDPIVVVNNIKIAKEQNEKIRSGGTDFICYMLITLLGFSRMYLGMHSLNQLILGVVFGYYNLFIMTAYIEPTLDEYLNRLFNEDFFDKSRAKWKLFICYFIASLIPVVLYYLKDLENPVNSSPVWTEWWPVVSAEATPYVQKFGYIKCFLDSGVIGALFGFLFAVHSFNFKYTMPTVGLACISLQMFILRTLMTAVVSGLPFALLYFIPVSNNHILEYMLHFNVPLLISSYSMVKYLPMVYKRFGLDIQGDFSVAADFKQSLINEP